ncbi:VOC family protein [Marinitoga sp. 38H-ov]|uniref:VOC family protein n=1 Tax=Marinitoga sp. 38H-ov TaxID=1755814 RepID=UPI0019D19FAE|nr:VOC family protein [Marinitoga sp. 38H-ov]
MPEEKLEKIMHWELKIKDQILYFSDYAEVVEGNMVFLNINCESEEEIINIYEKLSEGGKIYMELQDTFWGAKFATLIDKYGINWSLNYQKTGE